MKGINKMYKLKCFFFTSLIFSSINVYAFDLNAEKLLQEIGNEVIKNFPDSTSANSDSGAGNDSSNSSSSNNSQNKQAKNEEASGAVNATNLNRIINLQQEPSFDPAMGVAMVFDNPETVKSKNSKYCGSNEFELLSREPILDINTKQPKKFNDGAIQYRYKVKVLDGFNGKVTFPKGQQTNESCKGFEGWTSSTGARFDIPTKIRKVYDSKF